MMKKLFLLSTVLLLYEGSFCQSIVPSVIAASGEYFTNANNTLSWTMGESIIDTYSNTNNSITQGFQQPLYTTVGVKENLAESVSVNVYPNPVNEHLNISVQAQNSGSVTIEIFDATGRLLIRKIQTAKQFTTTIDMKGFSSALYLLKVTSEEQNIFKTFKIQNLY